MTSNALLIVDRLTTVFDTEGSEVRAVDDVSFVVREGETVGLVGESGSGKSVTALSILRLVQPPGRIASGTITFDGHDLLALPEEEMRTVRGRRISLVFQEPMSALNPVFTIGDQVADALVAHGRTRQDARREATHLLDVVRLADPVRAARSYPHELSGGMRQRALIAAAIACRPALVIADEPTTALDLAIQSEILDLLGEMKKQYALALLLITHDLRVVAEMADRVLVMYRGRLVEQAATRAILSRPQHPYTRTLVEAVDAPRLKPGGPTSSSGVNGPAQCEVGLPAFRPGARQEVPFLEVRNLVKRFAPRRAGNRTRPVRAIDDVSFSIEQGEMFGLVGESGSGKTTTGRCILRLEQADSGEVRFRGEDVLRASPARVRALRREMQIVFQDPFSALNPRMRVGRIVEEPLVIHGSGDRHARRARVEELFGLVGLDPSLARRYPHEFSGGQRQRIVLARALALGPSFIVADEPMSALDMSIQAQIVSLLVELQQRLSLTCLLVAHDLRLVERVCSRVAVMHEGRLVEMGRTETIFASPSHAYTQRLVSGLKPSAHQAPST